MERKFAVVLNKSYDLPRLLSGLGHVTAGLVASASDRLDELSFVDYRSADGDTFPWISDWSFIVLRGKGGHMAALRRSLLAQRLPCVVYLDTMLWGGSEAQQQATVDLPVEDLTLLAVATFGDKETIDGLTRRFSVWS